MCQPLARCYYDWLRVSEPADARSGATVPSPTGPSSSSAFDAFAGGAAAAAAAEVVLGVYCGTLDSRPASVAAAYPSLLLYSATNSLTLRFRTDGSVVGRGFRARLALVSPAGCGGRLERLARRGAGAILTSPGFGGAGTRYASALDCRWLVETAPGLLTRFELLVADLEYVQPPAAARSSAEAMLAWCTSNDLDRLEVRVPRLRASRCASSTTNQWDSVCRRTYKYCTSSTVVPYPAECCSCACRRFARSRWPATSSTARCSLRRAALSRSSRRSSSSSGASTRTARSLSYAFAATAAEPRRRLPPQHHRHLHRCARTLLISSRADDRTIRGRSVLIWLGARYNTVLCVYSTH